MRRYVLVRTLSIVPALLGVSVAVFLLVRLIPGTVVDQMVGTEGSYSEESMRALRAFFGLDAAPPRAVRALARVACCAATSAPAGGPGCRSSR